MLLICAPTSTSAQQPTAAPPAQTPTQAQSAPAPKPPVPNRLNNVLPAWIRVRGEFRERAEGFKSLGFVPDRDDSYLLTRFRLNATVQPTPMVGFTVQAQDARVANKSVGPTIAPFRDQFDLRMAYADVGTAKSPVAVRVGRQELVYGDQRLLGHVSWTNAARTFDAAKVMLRGKAFSLDVFGSSVVNVRDTAFNKSTFDASQFYGAYGIASKLVPKGSVEPYIFYRVGADQRTELGALGDLKASTIGVRWVGTLPAGLDYNTEMAFQTGSLGSDDVSAWAGHWALRDMLTKKYSVRVLGEFNYASGDAVPGDGIRGTFDQLYPTGHDKYGLSDQVGWKNIRHLRGGLELTPRKGLVVSGSYHSSWLAESRDALYNAGGAVLARIATGAPDSHVGQELDAQAMFTLSPQIQVGGGYAHIMPGAFLKQATPGASYSAPYVMVTYVFLADK